MLCFAIFGKVGKSVFSPTSLTEGAPPATFVARKQRTAKIIQSCISCKRDFCKGKIPTITKRIRSRMQGREKSMHVSPWNERLFAVWEGERSR